MSKIVTAIANIMGDVGSVKKEGVNEFHRYKYATASDILHKLQPLLAREGLVIFQNEVARDLIGGEALLAVNYEFTLVHKEGDIWPDRPKYTGMAAARNTKGGYDDKALNKCHTAARKYFMLALFQIPTGDYDDADEQEDRPNGKDASAKKPAGKYTDNYEANTKADLDRANPIKPVAVEPPVHPETGETGPHAIVETDDMRWGAKFVAAIKAAKTDAEIKAWMDVNCTRLDNVAIDAPKIHDRIITNIEVASDALKRSAA